MPISVELREIRMRLLHPFETSFGVTQDRRILLVKVSDGGFHGYGEVTAGEGPFLELFARQSRPGWTTWGLEKTKFDPPGTSEVT